MDHLKQGDRVWVEEDPYDGTAPIGFATVTRASSDGALIEVQLDPMLVSTDRVHPRPASGGRW